MDSLFYFAVWIHLTAVFGGQSAFGWLGLIPWVCLTQPRQIYPVQSVLGTHSKVGQKPGLNRNLKAANPLPGVLRISFPGVCFCCTLNSPIRLGVTQGSFTGMSLQEHVDDQCGYSFPLHSPMAVSELFSSLGPSSLPTVPE
ncbi:hypothetical protein BJX99DRAFT_8853 [Aspergillus californicus]